MKVATEEADSRLMTDSSERKLLQHECDKQNVYIYACNICILYSSVRNRVVSLHDYLCMYRLLQNHCIGILSYHRARIACCIVSYPAIATPHTNKQRPITFGIQ